MEETDWWRQEVRWSTNQWLLTGTTASTHTHTHTDPGHCFVFKCPVLAVSRPVLDGTLPTWPPTRSLTGRFRWRCCSRSVVLLR